MINKKYFILGIGLTFAIVSLLTFTLYTKVNGFIAGCSKDITIESTIGCVETAARFQPEIDLVTSLSGKKNLHLYAQILKSANRLLDYRQAFLGLQSVEPTTYMVLFQNDYELRANGGFIGSYGVVTIKDGQLDFRFQDIYVPDGQIPGHVDPPLPIQEAFKQGFWKLRDADWYPDYPTSAQNIRWFMREGGEKDPDFLITLNFKTVEKILKILGPVEIPEFHAKLSPQNFYQVLQSQAETNFFAGSTQKRDTLASVGKAFLQKLQDASPDQKKEIGLLLFRQIIDRNILVDAKDPQIQSVFEDLGFNGSLHYQGCGSNCLSDHLSIISTNLGANKANCCTQSSTVHKITRESNQIKHEIEIQFTNTSRIENPSPPDFFGGNYINFIRFYLPPEAAFLDIQNSPTLPTHTPLYPKPYEPGTQSTLIQTNRFGFKEVGFFHTTRANTVSKLKITYFLPIAQNKTLNLQVQKQNGVEQSPTSVFIFKDNQTTNLESNFQKTYQIPQN
jgi:hypothetical protein